MASYLRETAVSAERQRSFQELCTSLQSACKEADVAMPLFTEWDLHRFLTLTC
jgi:hypothetical protein